MAMVSAASWMRLLWLNLGWRDIEIITASTAVYSLIPYVEFFNYHEFGTNSIRGLSKQVKSNQIFKKAYSQFVTRKLGNVNCKPDLSLKRLEGPSNDLRARQSQHIAPHI